MCILYDPGIWGQLHIRIQLHNAENWLRCTILEVMIFLAHRLVLQHKLIDSRTR